MATSSGTTDFDVRRSPLGRSLESHPGRYNFFQVVRLLQRLSGRPRLIGDFGPPHEETIRFATSNALAFPPNDIESISWAEDDQPRVVVNFMGLSGPNGVLPYAFTELIRERARAKDYTIQEFFDLFNHRMISLFYQAWEKYRFFVSYERDQQDRFSRYLMSFVGLGTAGLDHRQVLPDETFLFYSGLLSLQPRSEASLQQILEDYFDVPVEVRQFVGTWRPLTASDQCTFETGDEYSDQLGVGAVAGDEIWDHQSRARIRLGPMNIVRYRQFLPGGSASMALKCLTQLFSNGQMEFEAQLILRQSDVPACELDDQTSAGVQLGWTSWVKSGDAFGRDPGDTILLT